MDNLSESEQKYKQMIAQLQTLLKEGCSVSETARRMGVSRSTVMKYREGCPDVLCRNLHKGGILHQYMEFIIANLQNGYTQSEIIRQLPHLYGYSKSRTLAHRYMEDLMKQYNLTVTRYRSSEQTTTSGDGMGASGKKYYYLTRKGIFQYLWMNTKLTREHHTTVWEKYPILWILKSCIMEFRGIFVKKSLALLYLFIEKFKVCPIKELSFFTIGLEKDILAMENAVSSPLSNGFVEGTNNK